MNFQNLCKCEDYFKIDIRIKINADKGSPYFIRWIPNEIEKQNNLNPNPSFIRELGLERSSRENLLWREWFDLRVEVWMVVLKYLIYLKKTKNILPCI